MTRIGFLNFVINTIFFYILISFIPLALGLQLRITVLYCLVQLIVGRYKDNVLLIWNEIRLILFSHFCFFILLVLFLKIDMLHLLSIFFILTIIASLFCVFFSRYSHIWFRRFFKKNVLIVGMGHTASQLTDVITHNRFALMDVRGYINCNNSELLPHSYQQEKIIFENVYSLDQADEIIEKEDINTIIIAIPQLISKDIDILMSEFSNKVDEIKVLPKVENMVTFDSRIDDFDGLLMISTAIGKISDFSLFVKRLLDIVGGIVGCLALVPLYFIVRHKNHKQGDFDPIFFKQRRIGKYGKEFTIYKFRTMVPNADKVLEDLMENDPDIRAEYTINKKLKNDPRITKAGKILREKSLDEFPQFINVLKGEMSLIGPRPYLPREKEDMGDFYDTIIQVKPGLTGMWQTHGRSDVDFAGRLKLDDWYFRNYSLWLDITILIRTIKTVLGGSDESAR